MMPSQLSRVRINPAQTETIDIRDLFKANRARMRRRNLMRSTRLVGFGLALMAAIVWRFYA